MSTSAADAESSFIIDDAETVTSALPDAVVDLILSYLLATELANSCRVCKRWLAVASANRLWHFHTRRLVSRALPDPDRLYAQLRAARACGRRAARAARAEVSRARAASALRKWAAEASGADSSSVAVSEETRNDDVNDSDTELDECDREADVSAGGLSSGGGSGEPSDSERARARRAARSAASSVRATLLRARTAALAPFRAALTATGFHRLSFHLLPILRLSGIYAARFEYIRKGVRDLFHPTPDNVLRCVYHRVFLFRPDGEVFSGLIPGEIAEAVRDFRRIITRVRAASDAGDAASAEVALRALGPQPTESGLGEPVPVRTLPPEADSARAGVRIATPRIVHLARADRGDRSLGRGVYRQVGNLVYATIVTGGHNIYTRWSFQVSDAGTTLAVHSASLLSIEDGVPVSAWQATELPLDQTVLTWKRADVLGGEHV